MTINFSVGDYVTPNDAFIKGGLQNEPKTPLLVQTLSTLGTLSKMSCQVTGIGSIGNPAKSYIKLLPTDTTNISYRQGLGVTVYFTSDTLLNNSFESSTVFIPDSIVLRCLNDSGSTIVSGAVVRQTGFDTTAQLPTIGLADASSSSTSVFLGVASESIADGSVGSILISGSFQADTSSFTLNSNVYLSDTAGAISTTAGTVSTVVGRVLSVSTEGAIAVSSSFSSSSGASGSPSGISGNLGANDQRVVRTNGTGGSTVEGSNVIVYDGGQVSWPTGLGSIGHILGPTDASLNLSAPNTGQSVQIYGGNPSGSGDAGSIWVWGGQASVTGAEAGWVGLYPGWGDADAGGGSVEIMLGSGSPPGNCTIILSEDYSGNDEHGHFKVQSYDFSTELFKVDPFETTVSTDSLTVNSPSVSIGDGTDQISISGSPVNLSGDVSLDGSLSSNQLTSVNFRLSDGSGGFQISARNASSLESVRQIVGGTVPLTNNVSTAILTTPIFNDGQAVGGQLKYSVRVVTAFASTQVVTGTVVFSVLKFGGTINSQLSTPVSTSVVSAGSLTVTPSVATVASGFTLNLTAASSGVTVDDIQADFNLDIFSDQLASSYTIP